jgi:glutathione S-transferase
MKLYDFAAAPSPRRVRMFLAEKGLEVETVQVDLAHGEEFGDAFRRVNPRCVVPVLELDDGTCIGEAAVICRYLEALHPEPPLLGSDPRERAVIEMWDRAMEEDGFRAIAEVVRNTSPAFEDRALTGTVRYPQLPALAERGARRTRQFLDDLDARLADSPYVAGETFSVADITAFISIDFARWAKVRPGPEHAHLKRWHDEISARPSAGA